VSATVPGPLFDPSDQNVRRGRTRSRLRASLRDAAQRAALTERFALVTESILAPSARRSDPEPEPPVAPPIRQVVDVPAMSRRQRAVYWALTGLWVLVLWRFWSWWLQPSHRGALGLYIVATVAMGYLSTILPCFYWFFVGRMRRPVHMEPSPGRRVAMMTLCVPSHETLDVIACQLETLGRVRYPHDCWVLDEGGSPEVRAIAEEFGVHYFTRKDVPRWNQSGPPFQAKTKAGNVNAWLDHIQSEGIDYDVFVQLDIDHRPEPEYLERTLGYFDDPEVAWVQAPSVANNLDSWTARGLAEQDLVLQGPLQMGFYGHSRTPFIIGSHTTYRMSAIREIGGFQPTRAEDHLDTVVLAANGYSGVYVPEIIASGEGPSDLGTYMGQQFAWAYSMVQIFFSHTPRLLRRYSLRQAFQFLMAQSWYTLWSVSLALLWALPIVSLLSDRSIANVALSQFLTYSAAVTLASTLMWWWSRRWFQPQGIGLTWRGLLLEIARWPIVLWAVINVVVGIRRSYMITPKGAQTGAPASGARLYGLHLVLVAIGLIAVTVFRVTVTGAPSEGYLALVLFNTGAVLVLLLVTIALELRDLRGRIGGLAVVLRVRGGSVLAVGLALAGTVAATHAAWAPMAHAIR
jgi:cellulose synthase (UDP-forming)